MIALIPARSGSKRSPHKNVRLLAGHPMMAWTILEAQRSGLFDHIVVSTDSPDYADVALHYGAQVLMRPKELATDTSPDILWVRDALVRLPHCTAFSILRVTSPFRTAETIKRCWAEFVSHRDIDSIRAVEHAKQHPGKQWVEQTTGLISPVWPREWTDGVNTVPFHSMPTQSLPPVLVQNASLEMAWRRVVPRSISGSRVMPFYTRGYEGYDINTDADFLTAETLLARGLVRLEAPDDWTARLRSDANIDGNNEPDRKAVPADSVQQGAVDGGVHRKNRPRRAIR